MFEREFLFTAFAEDALSSMVGGEDVVGVVVFRYGDKRYIWRQSRAHLFQTRFDGVAGHGEKRVKN